MTAVLVVLVVLVVLALSLAGASVRGSRGLGGRGGLHLVAGQGQQGPVDALFPHEARPFTEWRGESSTPERRSDGAFTTCVTPFS